MTLTELCKEVLELDEKATKGEWSTLGEENEVHALEYQDKGGDPFHVAAYVHFPPNAELISHYRTSAPKLAKACQEMRECIKARCDHELENHPNCGFCIKLAEVEAIING